MKRFILVRTYHEVCIREVGASSIMCAYKRPPFEDYNMNGRTYRFFEGEPLYPFGFGLSYTSFKYSNLIVPESINTAQDFNASLVVENMGKVGGDEIEELYLNQAKSSEGEPIHFLAGFKRIHL